MLSLPEGYYLACRCSVPWANLSVGRVAQLVLEEILLSSTKQRCMKPWYASNMGCFRTCWCKISFIKWNHITMYHMQLVLKNATCPDHSSKYSTSLWCLHLECCLLETLCGGHGSEITVTKASETCFLSQVKAVSVQAI